MRKLLYDLKSHLMVENGVVKCTIGMISRKFFTVQFYIYTSTKSLDIDKFLSIVINVRKSPNVIKEFLLHF